MSDDDRLIDQTLAGRREAFGQLVLKYQDRLFNTLCHVTGRAEDSRDIVQEALIQAYLKLGSFRRQSGFYTWLYRIAMNVASTQRRRRRPAVSLDQLRETSHAEPVDCDCGPSQDVERTEQCDQVRRAIAKLSEEYRTVLVLREIDGCNYEEIAQMLDLPVGTVRSRLHRARLQLREELKGVLDGERIKD